MPGFRSLMRLTEKLADGTERALPREKLFIPGSILQVRVDNTNPLAYGVNDKLDVFFDNSPVFRLRPESALAGDEAGRVV